MKQLSILTTLFSIILLTACDGSIQPPHKIKILDKNSSTYAFRGADNSWPSASEQSVELASNVLANNYYLVVDTSGSMNEVSCSGQQPKMAVAKTALQSFVTKLPADANIGLLIFDRGYVKEVVEIGPNNHESVKTQIQDIHQGAGGTPLASAINMGYQALTKQARSQLSYGEYHLVIVTDGYADKGNQPDNIVRDMLNDSAINLHTIGFCIDENHALNLPGLTIYKSASNPQALMDGLESVLSESPDFQMNSFGG